MPYAWPAGCSSSPGVERLVHRPALRELVRRLDAGLVGHVLVEPHDGARLHLRRRVELAPVRGGRQRGRRPALLDGRLVEPLVHRRDDAVVGEAPEVRAVRQDDVRGGLGGGVRLDLREELRERQQLELDVHVRPGLLVLGEHGCQRELLVVALDADEAQLDLGAAGGRLGGLGRLLAAVAAGWAAGAAGLAASAGFDSAGLAASAGLAGAWVAARRRGRWRTGHHDQQRAEDAAAEPGKLPSGHRSYLRRFHGSAALAVIRHHSAWCWPRLGRRAQGRWNELWPS